MLPEKNNAGYTAAQVMMTLSAIAYASASQIGTELNNPNYATNQEWGIVWGPVPLTTDPDNLMYVVKHKSFNIHAVVIRGTYLTFSLGGLVDLFEDLEVKWPLNWMYPSTNGAVVAGGTAVGLVVLTAMKYQGKTLLDYFKSVPPTIIYVTGHSLGGCLTTVVAPWLLYCLTKANIKTAIFPYTFAAPTAGNKAFADFYNNTFPSSQRYFNNIDIIPMAWNNLPGIKALYPNGPACPDLMKDIIDLFAKWIAGIGYTQTNGNGNPLNGNIQNMQDWFNEALYQHGHNTYLSLLGAPNVNISSGFTVKMLSGHNLLREPEAGIIA